MRSFHEAQFEAFMRDRGPAPTLTGADGAARRPAVASHHSGDDEGSGADSSSESDA